MSLRHKFTRAGRAALAVLLAAVTLPIVLLVPSGTAQAGPAPVFTMFVPFAEQDISDALFTIAPAAAPAADLVTTIDVTSAADGSVIYWDHWEDGYEADIANPVQASTHVWGGLTPTEFTPGSTNYDVDAGTVIFLQNTVPLPRVSTNIFFDGRDKVASTRGFSMTRAGWDSTLGTLHAGAVGATDLSKYGTQFDIPVGENIGNVAFDYTGLTVMASDDDTLVEIDTDGDGDIDLTFPDLDQGETQYVNGGVNAGATVQTSKPSQVHLITGERGSNYEGRWYEIFPEEIRGDEYVAAAASTIASASVAIFVQNPNDTTITIAVDAQGTANDTNLVVAPGAFTSYTLPLGSGARFSSPGNPFVAVSATGVTGTRTHWYDWGYSLVPTSSLTPGVVIGWGDGAPGTTEPTHSPVWVAPLADTTIHVDRDADGIDDELIVATAYESVQVFDPDDDLTGAYIYTDDGGTLLSVAWGQDPSHEECCLAYDLGTAVLPNTSLVVTKSSTLAVDVNGDGLANPGDTLEYTVATVDAGALSLIDVNVVDTLPSTLNYVPNTTYVDGVLEPDDTVGTPFPVDGTGINVASLAPGAAVDVVFRAQLVDPFPLFTQQVRNTAFVTADDQPDATAVSIVPVVIPDLYIAKTSNATGPLMPGETFSYDIDVSNVGFAPQTNITVTDTLPADTTWVSTSVSRPVDDTSPGGSATVTENFSTIAYDNNTADWVTDWTETDSAGAGPSAGNVLIQSDLGSNRLRLQGANSAIYRAFDASTWGKMFLSTIWRRESFTSASDWVALEVSTTGGTSWIEIDRFSGVADDTAFVTTTPAYDLTRYIGQDVYLRWRTSPTFSGGAQFFFDDLQLDLDRRVMEVVAGTAPPTIYSSGELLTGENLTVTLTATVNPAISPAVDSITNNAATFSDESPTPVVSDATDPIARATVGDTVWHDQNGDGVVDGGEPRLAGVAVTLFDDIGTNLGTDVTDGSGNYLFTDLDPGDYTVTVTAGVPAGMAATFDIDGGNDSTSDVTLGFGEDNVTTDFGFATPVTLGDSVYADLDGDGVEDPGEFGIDAITVTITGPSHPGGTSTATVNGFYEFTNLLPGDYTVTVDTTPLSTAAYSTTGGDSQLVTLTSGNDDDTIDFGYVLPASIGDYVWHDLDVDGVQDVGEPPFVGVDVTITGPGITGSLTATTDANGFYLFSNLDAGTFDVTAVAGTGNLPAGYQSSTGGAAQTVTVAAEEIVDTADFGFYTLASIGDFVFDDLNGDGDWDAGEPGLPAVDVSIDGGDLTGPVTIATDVNGIYDFGGLTPGTYTVTVDTSGFPAGTVNTLDGTAPSVTVVSAQDFDTADFGYLFPATIGDFVFDDLNNDGDWDAGEPGIDGVEITLSGGTLPPGTTATTSGGGAYLFSGLAPADYTVTLSTATLPAGYSLTTANALPVTIISGSNVLTADFGASAPADIGDLIFHDLNADGDWDAGEPALPGVDVRLTGGALPPLGITDTTDVNGLYLFTDLDAGTYTATVDTGTVPAGYLVTAGDNTRTTTLQSNIDDLTLDLGYATTATIGDYVWNDLDGDGVQNDGLPSVVGFAGVDVTITGTSPGASHPGGSTIATGSNGDYSFAGLAPGDYTITIDAADISADAVNTFGGLSQSVTVVSDQTDNSVDFGFYIPATIGDRVWEDLDGDGTQDDGASGYVGITVTLSGGPTSRPPQVTGVDGAYDFTGLAPGNYTVTLTSTDLPAGAVNTFGGLSQSLSVVSGDDVDTVDFGFYEPATIGDRVWEDMNGDGLQNDGATGLSGVTVTLSGGPTVLPPQVTGADGAYDFAGLAPGTYTVTVDTADLAPGAISTTGGFSIGSIVVASGDDVDTADFGVAEPITIGDIVFDDLDGDGTHDGGEPGFGNVDVTITGTSPGASHPGGLTIQTAAGTGLYQFANLLPGTYDVDVDPSDVPVGYTNSSPTTITLTVESGDAVDTVDFGFVAPADLGDFVFEDLDADGAYDVGEPGLAGVTLELSGPGVTPGTTVTTGGSGAYSFGSLDPGTYTVTITAAPAGYTNTLGGPSQVTTLESGDSDLSLDFGFYLGASIGDRIFEDVNGNGVDDTDPGFSGVVVTLTGGTLPPLGITDTTDATGAYDFVGLQPGTYTVTVTSGLPAGATNTLGGASQSFTVVSGDDENDADFGYFVPATIGDRVWIDTNGDGIQDVGELGLVGVDLTISGGPPPTGGATVTTGADGAYDFTGVAPGTYAVTMDTTGPASGMLSTTGGAVVGTIVVVSGDDENDIDFGLAVPAAVGDLVFTDVNGNGVFDGADTVIPGITVTLTGPGPDLVDVTDGSGIYGFSGLLPGAYTVTIDTTPLPAGSFSTTGGFSLPVTLDSGETDNTIDFGTAVPAAIGDTLFDDLNNNGTQDLGEPGLANVDVSIVGPTHPLGMTISTGPTGTYSFTALAPGDYTVTVDTSDPQMNPAFVSSTGGDSQLRTLASGEVITDVDFGYTRPGTIGDFVFTDTNADGLQAGDSGLDGVLITLTGGALPPLGITATTAGGGAYDFTVLPGDYTVTITSGLPAGGFVTTASSFNVTLASGGDINSADFGVAQPATIGDRVFDDANGNGTDDADTGFPLVDVTISGGDLVVPLTVATGPTGDYSFAGLTPGTYTVTVDTADLPAGAVNTLGGAGQTVTVGSNETNNDVDFGYYLPSTLGDFVFEDRNGDGVFDVGEPGYDGVTVSLTGDATANQDTVNGVYDFTGLAPGSYTVTVDTADLPAGVVNTLGGASQSFVITSGTDENDADFAYYQPATVGDFVWDDLNGNGLQDDGATGIAGVTVTLTDVPSGGSTTVTQDTIANGAYDFTGVAPGTYTVSIDTADLAAGATSTTGGFAIGSVVVVSGDDIDTVDFGVVNPASLGDFVFQDFNGNGLPDPGDTGYGGVSVVVTGTSPGSSHPGGTTVVTAAGTGIYGLGGLLPGTYSVQVITGGSPVDGLIATTPNPQTVTLVSGQDDLTADFGYAVPATIGDQLFVDNNTNGVFDAGDTVIADVDVTLTGPGQPPLGTTIPSDASGIYTFTGLGPGTYTVTVDTSDPDFDAAWSSTTGGDAQTLTIASTDNIVTVDFGYNEPGNIGDLVYEDLNGDGVWQPGEPGLNGVTVTLSGGNLVVPLTTTTVNGAYSFPNVDPGTYNVATDVVVLASTTGGNNQPVTITSGETDNTIDFGYIAPAAIGDRIWHDLDDNGTQDVGEPGINGVTVTITGPGLPVGGVTDVTSGDGDYSFTGLIPGTFTIAVTTADLPSPAYAATPLSGGGTDSQNVTLSSGETNNDIDFGYAAPGSIGDWVFDDTNGDGVWQPGEPGFDGVTITLDDGSTTITQDTVNGSYDFTGLVPGTYTVTVDTGDLPAGAVNTLGGASRTIVLASTDDVDTADFGYYLPGSIGDLVFADVNGNGTFNIGDSGLGGVEVTLTGGGLVVPLTTTTTGAGAYLFSNLAPGSYDVTLTAGIPAGMNSTTGGNTQSVVITSGLDVLTADFGLAENVTVGDRIWHDLDNDGAQDLGEPGLTGVTLELRDVSSAVVDTQTSDSVGFYQFTNVAPGMYTVVVTSSPAGYTASTPESVPITVTSGNNIDTVDVGYATFASIGDLVWEDLDGNGIFDGAETGIDGLTVTLTGANLTVPLTTTTAGGGIYTFPNLDPGTYTVTVTPPAGAMATTVGGDAQTVTIASDEDLLTADFGYAMPASIGDRVWIDLDADGVQDGGEGGLGLIEVLLTGPLSSTTSDTTDGLGNYGFTNLLPGEYTVTINNLTVPVGAVSGTQLAATTAVSTTLTIVSGDVIDTVDFGYATTGTVSGTVFEDLDASTVHDLGEPGLPIVSVELVDGGVVIATVQTDVNGNYQFTAVDPGSYVVRPVVATVPPGFAGTTPPTIAVTVESDVAVTGIDFGYTRPSTIGDLVWHDVDADGVRDPGEVGIPAVDVELVNGSNVVIDTQTTDANGAYLFTAVDPGTYTVRVDLTTVPVGVNSGTTMVASAGVPTSVSVPIVSGDAIDTVDFAFHTTATIGDFVWHDLDAEGDQDGTEPGIDTVTVNLVNTTTSAVVSTITAAGGAYSFTGVAPGTYEVQIDETTVPPTYSSTTGNNPTTLIVVSDDLINTVDFGYASLAGGSIGNEVWDDLNADGVRQVGEPGIDGIVADLYLGGVFVATRTTVGGAYLFTGLAPGDYEVRVDPSTVPAGYVATTAGTNGGNTQATTILSGGTDMTLDFGYAAAGTVGDFVWHDLDGDGLQDVGEPGIGGVTVELRSGATVVASAVTDGAGAYSLSAAPGAYIVVIDGATVPSGVNSGTPLTATTPTSVAVAITSNSVQDDVDFGYVTTAIIGDQIFSDLDGDGVEDPGEPGIAGVTLVLNDITNGGPAVTVVSGPDGSYSFAGLTPGDYTVQVDASTVPPGAVATTTTSAVPVTVESDDDIDTIDFGFALPGTIAGRIFTDQAADGSETGDPGVVGLQVELLLGGVVVDTMNTLADGSYLFTNVAPGDYTVRPALPAGAQYTVPNAVGPGIDDTVDSDVIPATGETGIITLVSGADIIDVDGGIYLPATIGDTVFYDIDGDGVQDAGEPGLAGVAVEVRDVNGVVIATTTTGLGGLYSVDVTPGTHTVSITTPAGYRVNAGGDSLVVTVLSGETDNDVDFGVLGAGSIAGQIVYDVAGDATIDLSDPPLPGVVVTATWAGPDGPVVYTTATNPDGTYNFSDLPPGTFDVTVDESTLPDGIIDPTIDPDATIDFTTTVSVSGGPVTDVDFGTTGTARLGDNVFLDSNGDGILNPGESGVAGVTVTTVVMTTSGPVTFVTVTDSDGFYEFTDLPAGDYTVTIASTTIPAGMVRSSADPTTTLVINGADDTLDVPLVLLEGPTAVDDFETTPRNTPVTVPVTGNDVVVPGTTVTVTDATDPDNGTAVINPDGTITYTPDTGFVGTDVFDYTICDLDSLALTGDTPANRAIFCSTATVTIVTPPPPPLSGTSSNPPPETTDPPEVSTSTGTPIPRTGAETGTIQTLALGFLLGGLALLGLSRRRREA